MASLRGIRGPLPTPSRTTAPNTKAYQVEGETMGMTIRRNSPYRTRQNISKRNRRSR